MKPWLRKTCPSAGGIPSTIDVSDVDKSLSGNSEMQAMILTLLKRKLWRAPSPPSWMLRESVFIVVSSALIAYLVPSPLSLAAFALLMVMWAADSAWHAHWLGQRWLSGRFTHWDQACALALIASLSAMFIEPSKIAESLAVGGGKH
jgi:hypothetical protein